MWSRWTCATCRPGPTAMQSPESEGYRQGALAGDPCPALLPTRHGRLPHPDRPARPLSARSPAYSTGHPNRPKLWYILDEPSIGLHQRDNQRLIDSLKTLRDVGNTVIVVEHDEDMMRQADHLIDIGPGAGKHGGHVVAQGPPASHLAQGSVTAQFLDGRKQIAIPSKRRKGNRKNCPDGATGHNLKGVDLKLPLHLQVTGVSGSGKSTWSTRRSTRPAQPLLRETSAPSRSRSSRVFSTWTSRHRPSPIGRTLRSNRPPTPGSSAKSETCSRNFRRRKSAATSPAGSLSMWWADAVKPAKAPD